MVSAGSRSSPRTTWLACRLIETCPKFNLSNLVKSLSNIENSSTWSVYSHRSVIILLVLSRPLVTRLAAPHFCRSTSTSPPPSGNWDLWGWNQLRLISQPSDEWSNACLWSRSLKAAADKNPISLTMPSADAAQMRAEQPSSHWSSCECYFVLESVSQSLAESCNVNMRIRCNNRCNVH